MWLPKLFSRKFTRDAVKHEMLVREQAMQLAYYAKKQTDKYPTLYDWKKNPKEYENHILWWFGLWESHIGQDTFTCINLTTRD